MSDQPDDGGTVWCEVCQEDVPQGYAHAHDEPLPEDARERLRELLERRDSDV